MKFENHDFDHAIQYYADHLVADYNETTVRSYGPTANPTVNKYSVEFAKGSKFLKVISVSWGSRSVHSFICVKPDGKFKYGDILKAASWATPAKNFARGNVLDTDSYKSVQWTGC